MEEFDPRHARFGQAMAKARRRAGRNQDSLARHLGWSPGHISHIESGRRKLDESRVGTVDTFLSANNRLVRLYEEIYQAGRIDWLGQLHRLQIESEMIREYQANLFPGQLQQPAYAKMAVSSGAPWLSAKEIQQRVNFRTQWRKDLLREDGPRYHVVLDDITVVRPIGPPEIMRDQIEATLKLAESGRIVLQMHGWDQHPHAGLDGPFSVITSASAPDMVHVESIYGGSQTDTAHDVRNFGMLFSTLQATARSPQQSITFLKEMRTKYE
ncbi:helix-turn-helix domain-containing protein [Nocardiopsis metallicus]|uniref:Transcriptional regulator with XRE-family HTH domain n=1 Tax=Nocardiopsis metallicus TaxID=179819 RepID=A0A840WCP3_9ACTN|nr:helix-turn-helix transcriptional regulator [Nocardiopsis metallicus]MBB5494790.1 transcriptional regulator with XRE-family HTH domain [Nocardiopsis metallicus]